MARRDAHADDPETDMSIDTRVGTDTRGSIGTRGPSAGRNFLFLQGLAGPFFSQLGDALADRGHGVHRVNFHGGDRLCWRRAGAVDYRGDLSGWPAYLERLAEDRAITDIVLFGDCRPLHRAAVGVARQMHIQVHVFEEGYIRPDWVTLEVGGVNGHSTLPRDPEYYLELARRLPKIPQMPPVASSFARRAREDLVYNFGAMLLSPLYPGYETHRPYHPLVEYAGWAKRLAGKRGAKARSAASLAALHADGRPYFVFPLQLDCDYQIRTHSSFTGMRAAIEEIVASFAAHAPENTLLVVKAHPLENGLHDWRSVTLDTAAECGIADRTVFLEEADIALLVRDAHGLVTINSTTGTLALAHGVPVITLGQAIYDIPRVTYQDSLDSFWNNWVPPQAEVWEAFRRVLVHRCLVHGGFFSEQGRAMLVAASAERLSNAATLTAPQAGRNPAPSQPDPLLAAARG
jgi:capsular polysaccharide export protein